MKTPEEKAKELYENFLPYVETLDYDNDYHLPKYAKNCAILCVEEILKVLTYGTPIPEVGRVLLKNVDVKFWEDVIVEIEKL